MNNLITIIVPIYNAEKYLHKCIQSLVNQTYQNLEIILVNDGSTDDSGIIIEKYAKKDARIQVFNQKNAGVSKARNIALDIMKGDWVLFVDADDYLEINFCEKILQQAIRTNAEVIITEGHKRFSEYDEQTQLLSKGVIEKIKYACIAYDENVFSYNIDAPWGKFFSAPIIKENKIRFPENISRSEDALFCVTVYEMAEKIVYYRWAGYMHIENTESLCKRFNPNAVEELLKILEEKKKWIDIYHCDEEIYTKALAYRVLPGINECENVYFFHEDNKDSLWGKIKKYQNLLNIEKIRNAIKLLKREDIEFIPYQKRLVLYKFNLGWMIILRKY